VLYGLWHIQSLFKSVVPALKTSWQDYMCMRMMWEGIVHLLLGKVGM
jgi:hypothetical protein